MGRRPRSFTQLYADAERHRVGQLAKERAQVRLEFRRRKSEPVRIRGREHGSRREFYGGY